MVLSKHSMMKMLSAPSFEAARDHRRFQDFLSIPFRFKQRWWRNSVRASLGLAPSSMETSPWKRMARIWFSVRESEFIRTDPAIFCSGFSLPVSPVFQALKTVSMRLLQESSEYFTVIRSTTPAMKSTCLIWSQMMTELRFSASYSTT